MRPSFTPSRFGSNHPKPTLASGVLCLLFAALIPLSVRSGERSNVCSLVPFGRVKRDSQPYFIGIAQFDTLLAGPGSTEFKLD